MRSLVKLFFVCTICLAAQAKASPTDAQLFRSIFSGLLDPSTGERPTHLIFAPTTGLFDEAEIYKQNECRANLSTSEPQETTARYHLCQLNTAFAGVTAPQLYEQGLKSSTPMSKEELNRLARSLEEQDVLVVIVPGIFGEFINKRAFEEVFPTQQDDGSLRNYSAFARQWRAKFDIPLDCSNARATDIFCDEQEKLQRISLQGSARGQRNVSMQDLIHAGSMDDENGHPVVRAMLFQVDGMSLESLSTQERNARIFNRRLEKFFEIMGHTPKHIVFLGYSRGTDFALEMLAQAKSDQKPWLNQVSSLVSLGGVVWGSALADDVRKNQNNKVYRQIKLLQTLSQDLSPLPNLKKSILSSANAFPFLLNTMAWFQFVKSAATIQSEEKVSLTDWIMNAIHNEVVPDPQFVMDLLVSELVNFGLLTEDAIASKLKSLDEAIAAAKNSDFVPLYNFFANLWPPAPPTADGLNSQTVKYNTDLRRFAILAKSSLEAVDELTTDSRLLWWRTHEIPTHVHYYSVSATMADPSTDLGQNPWGYIPGSPDDQSLVQNWQSFQKVNLSGEYMGTALNDSQVAIQKTVFWPKLIASLNPRNDGVRFTPLAILGTHHWGMALPIVTQIRHLNGKSERQAEIVNPFPRTALLKAVALAIANDLQENGRN